MNIVQLVQGSEEWKVWRSGGIGGSDSPVVEGISPYRTPRQLYLEKIGAPAELDEEDNEFIFAKGHKTEGLIREQFRELTKVEMKPVCLVSAKVPCMRASLDGFDSRLGVLEGKLVGHAVLEAARTKKEIPAHHMSQIQHELIVAGADVGHWFGHDGKNTGVLITVQADAKYQRMLILKELDFWNLVQTRNIPPLTDRDYLVPDDIKLLQELRDAKEQAANAQAYYEQIRDRAIDAYKHPRIAGAGIKIFRSERQGSIKYAEIPEIQALGEGYLNKFRGKGSLSWSVIMEKAKKEST